METRLSEAGVGVSVLVCAHRDDQFLELAIGSVLSETHLPMEVVLVANGDDCHAIAQRYAQRDERMRVITSGIRGLTANLDLGLHFCRYSLVARMDADDLMVAGRIGRQVREFIQDPELTVCGSVYDLIDLKGNLVGRRQLPLTDDAIRRRLPFSNPLCHPSVMFRREAVMNVGGYLTGLYAEDYDLWVRMARIPQTKFKNIEVPLVRYRDWRTDARGSAMAYAVAATSCFVTSLHGSSPRYLLGTLAWMGKFLCAKLRPATRRLR